MHEEVSYTLITALVVIPLVLLVFWLLRVMAVSWRMQAALTAFPGT